MLLIFTHYSLCIFVVLLANNITVYISVGVIKSMYYTFTMTFHFKPNSMLNISTCMQERSFTFGNIGGILCYS